MIRSLLGHDRPPVDINSPLTLAAAILVAVIGPEVFIVQPGFVQGMVAHFGFSEAQAGYVASAEMWGLALTTLLMSVLASRIDWRTLLLVSTLVVVAGNLGSLGTQEPAAFAAWRFVAGLGCGVLVSLSFTMVGLSANPDRNFGYLMAAVLSYGAIVLWLMPTAFDRVGMQGVIVFFALFPLTALPLLRYLPGSGGGQTESVSAAVDLGTPMKSLGIATMLTYFLAQGAVWAYLFLIGMAGGVSEQGVANGLMLSQFLGVAGAVVPALLANRFGRIAPLCLGLAGAIVPLLFLYGQFSAATFALIVCAYNFAWNMTHPYLLGAMTSFDRSGRLVAHAVSAQMLGLAIGPALAASALDGDDYATVLGLGIALFALAWLLILPPLIAARGRAINGV
ncbi:MAG: MFS transporter [Gammaproteobacteria bacterium]